MAYETASADVKRDVSRIETDVELVKSMGAWWPRRQSELCAMLEHSAIMSLRHLRKPLPSPFLPPSFRWPTH